jgi:hypothetical protein
MRNISLGLCASHVERVRGSVNGGIRKRQDNAACQESQGPHYFFSTQPPCPLSDDPKLSIAGAKPRAIVDEMPDRMHFWKISKPA